MMRYIKTIQKVIALAVCIWGVEYLQGALLTPKELSALRTTLTTLMVNQQLTHPNQLSPQFLTHQSVRTILIQKIGPYTPYISECSFKRLCLAVMGELNNTNIVKKRGLCLLTNNFNFMHTALVQLLGTESYGRLNEQFASINIAKRLLFLNEITNKFYSSHEGLTGCLRTVFIEGCNPAIRNPHYYEELQKALVINVETIRQLVTIIKETIQPYMNEDLAKAQARERTT